MKIGKNRKMDVQTNTNRLLCDLSGAYQKKAITGLSSVAERVYDNDILTRRLKPRLYAGR